VRPRTLLLAALCLAAGFGAGLVVSPGGETPARSVTPADARAPEEPEQHGERAEEPPDPRIALLKEENARLAEVLQRYEERDQAKEMLRTRLREPLEWLRGVAPKAFAGLTLDELRHMRELDLSGLPIEDDDLRHLEHLPSLRTLVLRGTAITDAGLVHLQKVRKLTYLGLRQTKVTDAGMRHLPAIETLTHLDLNMLPVTDDGLVRIRGMQLEFLRLNYTQVTDTGLAYLKEVDSLSRLDLWGTSITDSGTDHLWDLPSLTHLELGATTISKGWVDRFHAAHPGCTVRSRYGR
jgi:Leucine-rich repeat (LRR) protein